MPRFIATDSGAVEREIKRLLVTDSGAVERELKRLFVVDSGGTSRLVFQASFLNDAVDGETFNFSDITFNPDTSRNGVRIATDRDIDELDPFSQYTDRGDWLLTGGTAADYEVMFTYVSGSPDGGVTAGVFHAMSANRETFIEDATGPGQSTTAQVRVDIRRIAETSDAIQFTVNLSAQTDQL